MVRSPLSMMVSSNKATTACLGLHRNTIDHEMAPIGILPTVTMLTSSVLTMHLETPKTD